MLQCARHATGVRMRVAVETYTYELLLELVAGRRGLGLVPARILARTIWAVRRDVVPELVPVFRALDQALIDRPAGRRRRT